MTKWTKPSEGMPECEAGDRIAVIVVERENHNAPLKPRLIILEATEQGWSATEEVYGYYTPYDGVLWSYEKDICAIAYALDLVISTETVYAKTNRKSTRNHSEHLRRDDHAGSEPA